MSRSFNFVDELRPAGDEPIRVLARVHVLAAADGGRRGPFTARYRPNQNFGSAENRNFFIGQVEVPEGEWVYPGERRTHDYILQRRWPSRAVSARQTVAYPRGAALGRDGGTTFSMRMS